MPIETLIANIAAGTFSGVAKQYVQQSLQTLVSSHEEKDTDEIRALLEQEVLRIQKEAQQWPAEEAINIIAEASASTDEPSYGICGDDKKLFFGLRVINLADLEIHVSNMRGKVDICGENFQIPYMISAVPEIFLQNRDEKRIEVDCVCTKLWPTNVEQPRTGLLAARLELELQLMVMGPWQDKGSQLVQKKQSLWVPVRSMIEAVISSEKDIELVVFEWLRTNVPNKRTVTKSLAELEREINIPNGSASVFFKKLQKEKKGSWNIEIGNTVVEISHLSLPFLVV